MAIACVPSAILRDAGHAVWLWLSQIGAGGPRAGRDTDAPGALGRGGSDRIETNLREVVPQQRWRAGADSIHSATVIRLDFLLAHGDGLPCRSTGTTADRLRDATFGL